MSDQPPLPPPGWHDDPNDPTSLRYWDGAQWTDNRSPKPPAPAPVAVALDGWVDVKLSTVPGVVIASTKGKWYKVWAPASGGPLSDLCWARR